MSGASGIQNAWCQLLGHPGEVHLQREGQETPEVVTADVDIDCIASVREKLNVFRDRRPELYQIH